MVIFIALTFVPSFTSMLTEANLCIASLPATAWFGGLNKGATGGTKRLSHSESRLAFLVSSSSGMIISSLLESFRFGARITFLCCRPPCFPEPFELSFEWLLSLLFINFTFLSPCFCK